MTAGVAPSQAPGPAAPEARDPARDTPRESDDEEAGSGSGRTLVAPADPRARLAWLHDRVLAAVAAQPRPAGAPRAGPGVVPPAGPPPTPRAARPAGGPAPTAQ